MLDTSGSMTLNLDLMKAAAEQFIIRLLPEDKGMVGAFNNKIEFASADFTNDRDELARAIRSWTSATRRGCGTPSTRASSSCRASTAAASSLVFTDGDDTVSKLEPGQGRSTAPAPTR